MLHCFVFYWGRVMDKKNNVYKMPSRSFLDKARELMGEAQPRSVVMQNELLQELIERVTRLESLLKNGFMMLFHNTEVTH